jgi:hypothetical protein
MNIEGMPEDERLAILADLEQRREGLSAKVAGTLAGPATPGRPDVPVWEYEDFHRAHPEMSMETLTATRFPVVFFGGEDFTIESVAAHLHNDPDWLPTTTVESVIDSWRALFEAGVVRWDSERRAVEFIQPDDARKKVYQAWRAARRSATQEEDPKAPPERS